MLRNLLHDLYISLFSVHSPLPSSKIHESALQASSFQVQGSGRARRDAAARAMQGWHAQRLLGYGEIAEPIIKVIETPFLAINFYNVNYLGSLLCLDVYS